MNGITVVFDVVLTLMTSSLAQVPLQMIKVVCNLFQLTVSQ